jgi:hypothetical protein
VGVRVKRLHTLSTPRLDGVAEVVRRDTEKAITQLQGLPSAAMRILSDKSLADGVATPIAHGLGRVPSMVTCSLPRGAVSTGRIEEVRSSAFDRTRFVVLKATGWGATITVDVEVK